MGGNWWMLSHLLRVTQSVQSGFRFHLLGSGAGSCGQHMARPESAVAVPRRLRKLPSFWLSRALPNLSPQRCFFLHIRQWNSWRSPPGTLRSGFCRCWPLGTGAKVFAWTPGCHSVQPSLLGAGDVVQPGDGPWLRGPGGHT